MFTAVSLVLLALASCDSVPDSDRSDSPLSNTAVFEISDVTIYRDSLGVPHVHGVTDADAAFGFAFAQAEDNFSQIEENYLRATGRAAELLGESELIQDWINRSLDIERLSVDEYEKSPAALRRLLDGYAAGLNFYAESQPADPRRLLTRFEPWHPLALVRYLYYQNGFFRQSGISRSSIRTAFLEAGGAVSGSASELSVLPVNALFPRSEQGSNSWAVSASKSSSGAALLFINPHLPYFGSSQVYEGHVISDDGWNFSGYTRFGFPFPYVGFNEHLGWASTDNGVDQADAYFVRPNTPNDSQYQFGDETLPFVLRQDTIFVNTEGTSEAIPVTLRKSIHGPVVGFNDGAYLAVRMARFDEPGWMDQWYEMTRARTFRSFQQATSRLDMLFGNYLYADREGNIQYVYNAAAPLRSPEHDAGGIADGSNPDLLWNEYHPIADLPQVTNPLTGWLQNCNQSPFFTTASGNPEPSDFPRFLVAESDNARSRNARRILESQEKFSFEEWERLSLDTYMFTAAERVPHLIQAFDALPADHPYRSNDVEEAINNWRSWDYRSSTKSEETSLFVLWFERRTGGLGSLASVIVDLNERFGTWRVPWGELNRLQRLSPNKGQFSDQEESVESAGVPSWAGASYTVWSAARPGTKKRYATGGNSYVSVVEFGDQIRARSLHAFGASSVPGDEHYMDQAARMPVTAYKNAWLYLEDVRANAIKSYHPGQ